MVQSQDPRYGAGSVGREPEKEGVEFTRLRPGTKIRLVGDVTAEVIQNPRDGYWVLVRYLSAPNDPSVVGKEDMAFVYDLVTVLETPP